MCAGRSLAPHLLIVRPEIKGGEQTDLARGRLLTREIATQLNSLK